MAAAVALTFCWRLVSFNLLSLFLGKAPKMEAAFDTSVTTLGIRYIMARNRAKVKV